jgi:hypothetical protein
VQIQSTIPNLGAQLHWLTNIAQTDGNHRYQDVYAGHLHDDDLKLLVSKDTAELLEIIAVAICYTDDPRYAASTVGLSKLGLVGFAVIVMLPAWQAIFGND